MSGKCWAVVITVAVVVAAVYVWGALAQLGALK